MNYIEYQFYPVPFEPWNEIIVACLAEIGFESFMEEGQSVKAYIQSELLEEDALNHLLHNWSNIDALEMKWNLEIIAQQNWNAKWEADFVPVYIQDKLSIVAPFHDASARRNRVIEIERLGKIALRLASEGYVLIDSNVSEKQKKKSWERTLFPHMLSIWSALKPNFDCEDALSFPCPVYGRLHAWSSRAGNLEGMPNLFSKNYEAQALVAYLFDPNVSIVHFGRKTHW